MTDNTPLSPPTPSPENAMEKNQAEADIERFKRLVEHADVEFVGKDTEYVPANADLDRVDFPMPDDYNE